MRHREDWRDRTLALIAFYLAQQIGLTGVTYETFVAPYLSKAKAPPKTPEQRVREFQLLQRQREVAAARAAAPPTAASPMTLEIGR